MHDFEKYWEESASKESWANKAVAWNIWKEKQAIIDNLKAQLNNMEARYIEKKKERDELQNRLKAVYALSRMRAAVIGSWKREELSIKVRKAISHLVKKEQALRGAND